MMMTQDTPISDRLLKPAEVAEMLGVHRDTLMEWLRAGTLPGIKLPGGGWRISEHDLTAWLEARKTGKPPKPAPPQE